MVLAVAARLTVTGVNGHSGGRTRRAAREESPVEGDGVLGTRSAQAVQVGKQREVDYRKGHVPKNKGIIKKTCFRLQTREQVTGLMSLRFHFWVGAVIPHQRGPQAPVEPPDALRLQEFFCDLRGRDGPAGRRHRVVGAREHGVGGHQLGGRHHDRLRLLGSFKRGGGEQKINVNTPRRAQTGDPG